MNPKIKKILIIALIVFLLIIFFLAILGFTDLINFWIAAILTALFAFLVLPRLNEKTQH